MICKKRLTELYAELETARNAEDLAAFDQAMHRYLLYKQHGIELSKRQQAQVDRVTAERIGARREADQG